MQRGWLRGMDEHKGSFINQTHIQAFRFGTVTSRWSQLRLGQGEPSFAIHSIKHIYDLRYVEI